MLDKVPFPIKIALLTLILGLNVRAAEPPSDENPGLQAFSGPALLDRFDENADGKLNHTERHAMRDAFGGVDVPLLPTEPQRYADLPSLDHITESTLQRLDNSPRDNPLTDAGAVLGRVLFYDTQLSQNNTISCASCHHQHRAFADPRQFSVGFEGRYTMRNAMGLVNLRYTLLKGDPPGFFWDERAPTLEAQALMPIQDQVEMGMKLPDLEAKLQALPYYPDLFRAAFGSTRVTSKRIGQAVAQFMRALSSFDSRFDRASKATGSDDYLIDFEDFTKEENLGKSLFIDGVGGVAEIGCAHCHMPPTFGMPKSFNNGLDVYYVDRGLGTRDVPSNDPFTLSNDGKFKAPPLRNIALTAPYMHDGRFTTLEQVVEHYSSGVRPHTNLGLAVDDEQPADVSQTTGFRLTRVQKSALVAFLSTLTDESFISDPRFSDPFVRLRD